MKRRVPLWVFGLALGLLLVFVVRETWGYVREGGLQFDVRYYATAPWRLALPVLAGVAAGVFVWRFTRLPPRRRRTVALALWACANLSACVVGICVAAAVFRLGQEMAASGLLSPAVPGSLLSFVWPLCAFPVLLLAGSAVSWVVLARCYKEGSEAAIQPEGNGEPDGAAG